MLSDEAFWVILKHFLREDDKETSWKTSFFKKKERVKEIENNKTLLSVKCSAF